MARERGMSLLDAAESIELVEPVIEAMPVFSRAFASDRPPFVVGADAAVFAFTGGGAGFCATRNGATV
jgi:hypothetical protein